MKRRSFLSQKQAKSKKATDTAKSAAVWSLVGTILQGCSTSVPAAIPTDCECQPPKIPSELNQPKNAHALDDMKQILDEI